jgi:hypothetical protein
MAAAAAEAAALDPSAGLKNTLKIENVCYFPFAFLMLLGFLHPTRFLCDGQS